jgi:hypothetical protein
VLTFQTQSLLSCIAHACFLQPCVLWLFFLHAAAETEDAEEAQACLLVTLVVLSKGTVAMQQQPLRDAGAFRDAMKSVRVRWRSGQGLHATKSGNCLLLVWFTCNNC